MSVSALPLKVPSFIVIKICSIEFQFNIFSQQLDSNDRISSQKISQMREQMKHIWEPAQGQVFVIEFQVFQHKF